MAPFLHKLARALVEQAAEDLPNPGTLVRSVDNMERMEGYYILSIKFGAASVLAACLVIVWFL